MYLNADRRGQMADLGDDQEREAASEPDLVAQETLALGLGEGLGRGRRG